MKLTETFKLADLQFLELQILQSSNQRLAGRCERLVVDAATGSSLIFIENDGGFVWDNEDDAKLPTYLKRCDWVGHIIGCGASAPDLIDDIRSRQPFETSVDNWTLEYLRMQSQQQFNSKNLSVDYTSRCLLACVAQSIKAPAALHPDAASHRLMIVDTIESIYLVRLEETAQDVRRQSSDRIARWSNRPFQYSSAINPNVADIVVDILFNMVGTKPDIKLLDPTCGSGTFLAFAATRGALVEGWDVLPSCVEGSLSNLDHVANDQSQKSHSIRLQDATMAPNQVDSSIDCVVANLPWGINSVSYKNEHSAILRSVARRVLPGTPCALVTKSIHVQRELQSLGYDIVGHAHVPQRDFALPRGSKTKRGSNNNKRNKRDSSSSDCVVTIALSPAGDY